MSRWIGSKAAHLQGMPLRLLLCPVLAIWLMRNPISSGGGKLEHLHLRPCPFSFVFNLFFYAFLVCLSDFPKMPPRYDYLPRKKLLHAPRFLIIFRIGGHAFLQRILCLASMFLRVGKRSHHISCPLPCCMGMIFTVIS